MNLIDDTILLLNKLKKMLFTNDALSLEGDYSEELSSEEIEELLKTTNRNIDKVLDGLRNGEPVSSAKYAALMRAVIDIMMKPRELTNDNKILRWKLVASLEKMNNLIAEWNKNHDDNHIPTLGDVRRDLNNEIISNS